MNQVANEPSWAKFNQQVWLDPVTTALEKVDKKAKEPWATEFMSGAAISELKKKMTDGDFLKAGQKFVDELGPPVTSLMKKCSSLTNTKNASTVGSDDEDDE